MCHVSAQGIDERMINVHYYYYTFLVVLQCIRLDKKNNFLLGSIKYIIIVVVISFPMWTSDSLTLKALIKTASGKED